MFRRGRKRRGKSGCEKAGKYGMRVSRTKGKGKLSTLDRIKGRVRKQGADIFLKKEEIKRKGKVCSRRQDTKFERKET